MERVNNTTTLPVAAKWGLIVLAVATVAVMSGVAPAAAQAADGDGELTVNTPETTVDRASNTTIPVQIDSPEGVDPAAVEYTLAYNSTELKIMGVNSGDYFGDAFYSGSAVNADRETIRYVEFQGEGVSAEDGTVTEIDIRADSGFSGDVTSEIEFVGALVYYYGEDDVADFRPEMTAGSIDINTRPNLEAEITGLESDTGELTINASENVEITDLTVTDADGSDRLDGNVDDPEAEKNFAFDLNTSPTPEKLTAEVTAEGTAGSQLTATTSVEQFTTDADGSATIQSREGGTEIDVETDNEDTTANISLTESSTPPLGTDPPDNPVAGSYVQVNEIGVTVNTATVRVPNTGGYEDGDEVDMVYAADSDGSFSREEVENVRIETVDGTEYIAGEVSGFSTVAAVEVSTDPDEEIDDSPGLGGGDGGGGVAGGGVASDSAGDSGPPSFDQLRSTIRLVSPEQNSESPLEDVEPEQDGLVVTPDKANSVERIKFNEESLTGSVSVTEYGNPPQTIADDVTESAARDIDGVDSGSEYGEPDANVEMVSLADITPTVEATEDSSATVELTVDSSTVENPEQLTVLKETYSFDAQQWEWQQREPTIQETDNNKIRLQVDVESFSLFAIVETETEQTSGDDSATTNEASGLDIGNQPLFIIAAGVVLALLITVLLVRRLQNNDDESEFEWDPLNNR